VNVALSLLLMLAIALLLLCGTTVVLMARMLLRPPRMTDGKALYVLRRLSPADLGLKYEPADFQVNDPATRRPLRIAGWWIPCEGSTRCAIIIHGYGDAKVGGIAWAPMLYSLGWNVLAMDLRAHGESGGVNSTGGYYEREDVAAIIDEIRAARPGETGTVILFGVSLGSAVALAAAEMRNDVAAVIADSPFADFRSAAAAHGDLLGLPHRILPALAVRLAQRLSRSDFAAVRPVDILPRLKCAVMMILLEHEALNDSAADAALETAIAARTAAGAATHVWRLDARHALALAEFTDNYIAQVRCFLADLT
jgi:pimeloyl-ACP methyl ester carboxylesterase